MSFATGKTCEVDLSRWGFVHGRLVVVQVSLMTVLTLGVLMRVVRMRHLRVVVPVVMLRAEVFEGVSHLAIVMGHVIVPVTMNRCFVIVFDVVRSFHQNLLAVARPASFQRPWRLACARPSFAPRVETAGWRV